MIALVAVVSGFASGVGLRSLFFIGWEPVAFLALLAALFATAWLVRPRVWYASCALFLVFASFGIVRADLADTPLPDAFARDIGHRGAYEGVVVSDPDLRDAQQRVAVRVRSGNDETVMLIIAPRYPSVSVGDTVNAYGTLSVPEPFESENGSIFRYDKYLERDGIRFLLKYAYLDVVQSAPWYSLPAAFAHVKHAFLRGLAVALPEPYASLAGGVVIGGKSGLGTELQDAFVRSGLVQIIVLSGYNVMIVASVLMDLLAYFSVPRRARAITGAVALISFVGVAGFSATAVRAMLMALIALYARATARTYTAGRALLVTVLLMLIWNPLYLVFDPGFGLSVAATAGLIWFAPVIETHLTKISNAFWMNAIATTLAAQLFVLPLLLYDTGNLSLVSIPANLVTMPVTPLIMAVSAIAGFAGMLLASLPAFAVFIGLPAYVSNAYLILVAQKAAALPLAAFTIHAFPFWIVLVSYACLIYATARAYRSSMSDQLTFAMKTST